MLVLVLDASTTRMTSFHEGMVMATYPLTWVLASEDGGLKGSLAGQNYESSHLGFPTGNLDWVLMERIIIS